MGKTTILGDEVRQLRVPVDVVAHEPAGRHHLLAACPDVVEGTLDQHVAEALAAPVGGDLGVGHDEGSIALLVVGDTDELAVDQQLVAGPLGRVAYVHGHGTGLPAERPIATGANLAALDGGDPMVGRMVAGVLATLVGVVWILQGLDIRKGDGMSGEGIWAVLGAILVLFGLALIRGARRLRAERG